MNHQIKNPERLFTADVFTTGQVAYVCRTSPRTVSKWIDQKLLRGVRLPGSQDRRVDRADLIAFLDRHGMRKDRLGIDDR